MCSLKLCKQSRNKQIIATCICSNHFNVFWTQYIYETVERSKPKFPHIHTTRCSFKHVFYSLFLFTWNLFFDVENKSGLFLWMEESTNSSRLDLFTSLVNKCRMFKGSKDYSCIAVFPLSDLGEKVAPLPQRNRIRQW